MRKLVSLIVVYNALYIIQEEFNQASSFRFIIVQFFLKLVIYIGNFQLVTQQSKMEKTLIVIIVIILIFTIGWCILLKATAFFMILPNSVWNHANIVRHQYTTQEKRIFSKFKLCCRPLKVRIGIHSYSRKGKLMLFLFSMSKGTIETLLAFG